MGALVPRGPASPAVVEVAVALADELITTRLAVAAGIYLYVDELDRSHTLSQRIETDLGAYWHAVMHRREGDFSNSRYWLNRIVRMPDLRIADYDAYAFLQAVAEAEGDPPALVELQRAEWSALMDLSLSE